MNFLRKYIVLTLVMLITLSATGISISLHRCCGNIKSISWFAEAKECKMSAKKTQGKCASQMHKSFEKKACCENQQISIKESQKAPAAIQKVELKEKRQSFDVLFVYNFFKNWFKAAEEEEEHSSRPSPGLYVVEAIFVFLQQFRI